MEVLYQLSYPGGTVNFSGVLDPPAARLARRIGALVVSAYEAPGSCAEERALIFQVPSSSSRGMA
jgi:hypothetical protein